MSVLPDVPGRGAWTLQGGLLRLRPGHKNNTGYYRAPKSGEQMIGLPGSRPDATRSQTVVHLAVREIQRLLGGLKVDGLLGQATGAKLVVFQQWKGLTPDGIGGMATMRALVEPLIRVEASVRHVAVDVLGGIVAHESRFDFAAVGVPNGVDTGLAQINLAAHRSVSVAQAMRPEYALTWTANDLRINWEKFNDQTRVDAWDLAIAAHNSPRSAASWYASGTPPFSQSREDNGFPQIDEYVAQVRAAWEETQ